MDERIIAQFWWFLEPKQWWLRHLLFWSYRFNNYIFYGLGFQDLDLTAGKFVLTCELLMYIVFAYFYILVLVPKFLFQSKITSFMLLSILSITAMTYIDHVLFPFNGTFTFFETYHGSFVASVETYLQIVGLRVIVEFLHTQKIMQDLKTENFKAELAYLKSQINPHFLFNTLNNIAVISEKYPERVTPILIGLSNILRYQLYESDKTNVLLSKEIENLRHYLKLEAMRLNNAECQVRLEGSPNNLTVAPLLFLPFFENAIKHGANTSGKTSIDILFKIEEKNVLFVAKNSKPTFKPKQLQGGIGLKNIQRRLELLYPNRYKLVINDTLESYEIVLNIQFQ